MNNNLSAFPIPFVLPDYFLKDKREKRKQSGLPGREQGKNGISAFRLKTGGTSGFIMPDFYLPAQRL